MGRCKKLLRYKRSYKAARPSIIVEGFLVYTVKESASVKVNFHFANNLQARKTSFSEFANIRLFYGLRELIGFVEISLRSKLTQWTDYELCTSNFSEGQEVENKNNLSWQN